jgi:hypothetical protein
MLGTALGIAAWMVGARFGWHLAGLWIDQWDAEKAARAKAMRNVTPGSV